MRLKRFQFSLRTLLAVVLGIGALSCVGYWVYPTIAAAIYWRNMKEADFAEWRTVFDGDDRTGEILVQWALDDPSSIRRRWGADLASRRTYHSQETTERLMNVLKIDSGERYVAGRALLKCDPTAPQLDSLLRRKMAGGDSDKYEALKLISNRIFPSLNGSYYPTPETQRSLIGLLDDPNEKMRIKALLVIEAIGLFTFPVTSKLEQIEKTDTVEMVKLASRMLDYLKGRKSSSKK